MNWSKAKTVLIVFFLIINIFLVCNIVYSANKATVITPEILASTVEVLAKNDITINSDIVSRKSSVLPYVEANNIITSNDEFAEKMLGTGCTAVGNSQYTAPNLSLTVNGDYFSFIAAAPVCADITSGINAENAQKTAAAVLDKYSVQLGRYDTEVQQNGDTYEVIFTKKIKSSYVFSSKLRVVMTAKGVSEISGVWFNEISKVTAFSKKNSLNSITGVLVEFILNEQRPQGDITITDLNLGYYIDGGIYHKSAVLTPAWEIVLSDGSRYYADARAK